MKQFRQALDERAVDDQGRTWFYVPYDQLNGAFGPWSRLPAEQVGLVFVETPWKASLRPYHKQKLALILANQRHFALEQAARGMAVRYVVGSGPYRDALAAVIRDVGPLTAMTPAERELRFDLDGLATSGGLHVVPHEGWLTTSEQFRAAQPKGPPWRMDGFYRHVRQATGILMADGKPVGGRYSFDAENRQPWRGTPSAAVPPAMTPDAITLEVGDLILRRLADHPGHLDLGQLPATAADAARLWDWAKAACLPHFGPFEDAMTQRSTTLFHTRVSGLLNLHRLLPKDLVADVAAMALPLPSQEGFIRQVLGWREFVRHVHGATDGFRTVPEGADGGPNVLGANQPLPPAYWGSPSGMACLDTVVRSVWDEGYSHHITRLMILSNLATLLDVSPRELTDWFWVAYTDAFDWVVEPNVLGMGTYASGDVMTTKPYVSGAAYIDRMSDYCGDCWFHPKSSCPITPLYWAFLARHRESLAGNHRMAVPLASLAKRAPERLDRDAAVFAAVSATLARGEVLLPGALP
jgi:deoxyribodipyrimidine photolyase-related protein